MKRTIKYLSILLISTVLFVNTVFAADFSISLTSNSVTAGNTVSLKIDGTASGLTGRFNISTSNANVASLSSSYVWVEDNVQYVTITAKSAGTATITVTPTDGISDRNATEPKLSVRTIQLTVNAQRTTTNNGGGNSTNAQTKTKSSNNFLSSLTIEGLEIDPKFDKEVLEYSVKIPAETEKIKINAQLADSNSKVTGTGEVKVTTGLNTLELVVTAENGSKRTYTIKATVEELKPLNVTVNNESFTIVRKRSELPKISEYFTEKDIKIGEDTIEGYYNDTLKYQVVGLKNAKGNIEYYIYKNNKYTLYKEYTFGGTTLEILDKDIDNHFIKTSFKYDGDKITSYQAAKVDIIKNTYALDNENIIGNQFYLFYARNVETGKENLYQYDALEKTVQRYNTEIIDMYKTSTDTYYMYLLGALLLIGLLILMLAVTLIKKGKKQTPKKEIKSTNKRKKIEIEDDEEEEEDDE